ncbi:MAG TPA: hypothetical protein PL041_02010 [Melioribacteraceae bacterium]|nr:hypothetical protein [Melioribacteraceae bacterium]
MKKIAIFFVFAILIFSLGCDKNENQTQRSKYLNKKIDNVNFSNIPDSILSLYQNYAGILAVREMKLDPKLYESVVEIPSEIKNLLFNSLCQVYNANYLSARLTVIEQYKIGVYPNPETKNFLIEIDTSEAWVKTLILNHTYSGNQKFDSLTNRYNLKFSNYFNFIGFNGFSYYSESQINLNALFYQLKDIKGIKNAFADNSLGDGSNITAEVFDDFVELIYSFGFGDCPSGCIYRHYWKFRVYYDGIVEYLYEWGDPLN